jgi:beta-galactosidase
MIVHKKHRPKPVQRGSGAAAELASVGQEMGRRGRLAPFLPSLPHRREDGGGGKTCWGTFRLGLVRGFLLLALCLTASLGMRAWAGVESNGTWRETTPARDRFCLNGEWQFQFLEGEWQTPPALGEVDGYDWRARMRVPGIWKQQTWGYEAMFLEGPLAEAAPRCWRAWYKRSFFVPAEWAGKRVVLEFGGVGYKALVYVNRRLAGTHVGGRTPFTVDISAAAKPGQDNELLIYNTGFGPYATRPPEGPISFNATSGIWGDVYLAATSQVYVRDAFIKTSVRQHRITALLEIANATAQTRTVTVDNLVRDGKEVVLALPAQAVTVAAGTVAKVEVEQPWAEPHLWSLEDPHLYVMSTRLSDAGTLVDEKPTRFGFREFWIDGRDFRLNGTLVRLRNFPFGVGDGPAQMRPEYLRTWFRIMKAKLGHNSIRLQWILTTDVASVADEVGLLVEAGTGLVGGDQSACWNWPAATATIHGEIDEWVRAQRNHPSIVLWSTNNECWSMVDVKNERDGQPAAIGIYKWLLGLSDKIRANDDTRVITHHHLGDMFDWTRSYLEENFEAGDLMGRADTYTLHYPQTFRFNPEEIEVATYWAARKNKPLIVGEFGGIKCCLRGNTAGDVINGEEFVYSVPAESKALYYYFRRVVGGWRAAGVSGIFAWFPNIYAMKKAIPGRHDFAWDDLTTPGMKPFWTPYSWINPGWVKDQPESIPDNADPRFNWRYWDLLSETFSPLLINLWGDYWEHNYLAGERVTRTARLVNDTALPQEVTWSWELTGNGNRLAGETAAVRLGQGEIKELSIAMTLPEVTSRQELAFHLTARGGGLASHDGLDITVYPAAAVARPSFPPARVALYDRAGKTAGVLDRLGIVYRRLDKVVGELRPDSSDVLIVGCDSADATLTARAMAAVPTNVRDAVRGFVEAGRTALFFEQGRDTYGALNFIFPGIPAPPIEYSSVSYTPCSYVDVAAPGHPVFAGLKHGLSQWRGEYGRVAEFALPRPYGTSARPLLFAGRWGTALLEGRCGKGQFILCQANVTTRYGSDPEATILLHNLLTYALSLQPVRALPAATVGDVGGLLGGVRAANQTNGFTATDITGALAGTDLGPYGVLILGRGSVAAGSEVRVNAPQILAFARAGGTVLVLPQKPGAFASDWLPGRVGVREVSSQWVFKSGTASPVIWGVSAFDLVPYHAYGYGMPNVWPAPKVSAELCDWSSDWASLLTVCREPANWDFGLSQPCGQADPTGGSAMLEARCGKGRIILCQLDLDTACAALPADAFQPYPVGGPDGNPNDGSTFGAERIAPRLIADALLTNLGVPMADNAGPARR